MLVPEPVGVLIREDSLTGEMDVLGPVVVFLPTNPDRRDQARVFVHVPLPEVEQDSH